MGCKVLAGNGFGVGGGRVALTDFSFFTVVTIVYKQVCVDF